ncbi:hypothetical protein ACIQTZ_14060 [Paenarthrobacter sp. NPDC090520]|uniref:hypothetical protein n=1 Tax=unclassified Paenarthrobacter TaxID=2634190 RepID=UPI0038001556
MRSDVTRRIRWSWLGVATLSLVAVVIVFGMRTGYCIDYAMAVSAEGQCSSSLDPSAWVLALLGLLVAVFATFRAFSKRR